MFGLKQRMEERREQQRQAEQAELQAEWQTRGRGDGREGRKEKQNHHLLCGCWAPSPGRSFLDTFWALWPTLLIF